MTKPVLASALALSGILLTAAPSFAQGAPRKERSIQIREGERCPRSTDDEVIVCYTEKPGDQYRIPERFRGPLPEDAISNTQRVAEAEAATDSGTLSCSAIGPGGFTGCANQEYRAWAEQRRRAQAVRERSVDD